MWTRTPGTASFRVALSHASSQTVAVTVVTSDGTATSGDDYTAVNRRVTFQPSYTLMSVTVPIIDDTRDEPDETFMLQMSAPSANAELSTTSDAEATIRDDDISPPGAVLNLSVDCSAVGTNGEIAITWLPGTGAAPPGFQVEVEYPSYHWSTNPYAFAIAVVGATAQAHTFTGIIEGWGTYRILITAYVPGRGGVPAVAVVDCQPPLPVVSLSDTTLTVGEGNSVPVTAILDSIPNGTAAVLFSTSGGIGGTGSCFNGANFSVDQSSFVFTNATTASITFTACDDSDTDDETIALRLTTIGISGLQLGSPTTVIVTITDDDTADCHTWQQFDPVMNTCVNRPFLS